MVAVRVLAFLIGAVAVLATLASALRTVVLPRGIPSRLARVVFLATRQAFRIRVRPSVPYAKRDRIMAMYSPVALLVLLATWLLLVLVGFTLMYWGLGGRGLEEAFTLSGSSMLTVGFARPPDLSSIVLAFSEAGVGLMLLALLITYLPTLYGVFSRREAGVAALEVRAGAPPSGVELIQRSWRVDRLEALNDLWRQWEQWFLDIQETHTSFPAVVFFRSPQPEHSWITSAGAVLDGASLFLSSVDRPADPEAAFCIRSGYIALRRVAEFFRIPFDHSPAPVDPVSVGRDEFDVAWEELATQGVPLRSDREGAWRDFTGWRVNYDRVLVSLAGLTMAPYARWSSDRSFRDYRPRAILGGEHPGP